MVQELEDALPPIEEVVQLDREQTVPPPVNRPGVRLAPSLDLPVRVVHLRLDGVEEHVEGDRAVDMDRCVEDGVGALRGVVGSDRSPADAPETPGKRAVGAT